MKRFLQLMLAASLLLLALTACAESREPAPTPDAAPPQGSAPAQPVEPIPEGPAPEEPVTYPDNRDGCARELTEIPTVASLLEEQPDFPPLPAGSAAVAAMDRELRERIAPFEDDGDDAAGRLVESMVFATDRLLSIVIREKTWPNYGTDGFIWSLNYDVEADELLSCGEYLESAGYDYDAVCARIIEELAPKDYISFAIQHYYVDADGEIFLIVTAVRQPQGADPWKKILYYDLQAGSFTGPV